MIIIIIIITTIIIKARLTDNSIENKKPKGKLSKNKNRKNFLMRKLSSFVILYYFLGGLTVVSSRCAHTHKQTNKTEKVYSYLIIIIIIFFFMNIDESVIHYRLTCNACSADIFFKKHSKRAILAPTFLKSIITKRNIFKK